MAFFYFFLFENYNTQRNGKVEGQFTTQNPF